MAQRAYILHVLIHQYLHILIELAYFIETDKQRKGGNNRTRRMR